MKVKVNVCEAERKTLDWMVTKCEGFPDATDAMLFDLNHGGAGMFGYTTDWSLAGPIIERERIAIYPDSALDQPDIKWSADAEDALRWGGATPLIAAMRAYVVSKLGSEVEVPEELSEGSE